MVRSTFYCILLVLFNVKGLGGSGQIRETLNGWVQGFEKESLPGRIVEHYLGIPYAQSPVGNLRFEVNFN